MNEEQIADLAERILKPGKESESEKEILARTVFNVNAIALLGQLAAAGKDAEKEPRKN